MAQHAKFNYKTLEELKQDITRIGVNIPLASDLGVLGQSLVIDGKIVPNRLAVNPMEGCDGTADGRPSDLTRRRYERFAAGGAGLLWFEATSVVSEGRANPRQLMLNAEVKNDYAALLQDALEAARKAGHQKPYTVVQLNHSGRNSKPAGVPAPIIAANNPYLDAKFSSVYVISDAELEKLEDTYVAAAEAAADAGFDAVDIKACHGYLMAELLGARTRPGPYGGSFENRTRFLCNIVDKVRNKLGDRITLAVRLGVFDEVPQPYGWGVDKDDYHKPDFAEPVQLMQILWEKGVKLFNISLGNPYYNPHLTRPCDIGGYVSPFHPLEGIQLLLNAAKVMQAAVPEAAIMGTGLTWLREFAPNVAAACVQQGWLKLAGFGRQAFAYPDFATDLLTKGAFDSRKVCLACSKCTTIMRDGGCTGCVPRDAAKYAPIYQKGREGKLPADSDRVAEHI
ncbi:MAG: flavin oxidoreductase/NADH oxidase [Firmicutes bacterium]|nr:flavin oxidoreductase/NADH oxidase [Bacillota bacterium]